MVQPLNYKHLFYFWVVAKEGSVVRAAERLGIAAQTISGQIGLLERTQGRVLFTQQGRRLVLTEAGRTAMGYADQIFLLGEQLQRWLAEAAAEQGMRLAVGISDGLPKLVAFRLIEVALTMPQPVRLVCDEGEFEALLADLALHKLDVVLTDRPVAPGSGLRVFSHALGDCDMALFATPQLAERYGARFPAGLAGAPLLLPTRHNAIRARIDHWFEAQDVRPDVVGEFEDSALMQTFGRTGLGLFPAPAALAQDVLEQCNAHPVGLMAGVREQFFAISTERRITHPAVEAIRNATRQALFPSG